jgi:hypothetical protein
VSVHVRLCPSTRSIVSIISAIPPGTRQQKESLRYYTCTTSISKPNFRFLILPFFSTSESKRFSRFRFRRRHLNYFPFSNLIQNHVLDIPEGFNIKNS